MTACQGESHAGIQVSNFTLHHERLASSNSQQQQPAAAAAAAAATTTRLLHAHMIFGLDCLVEVFNATTRAKK